MNCSLKTISIAILFSFLFVASCEKKKSDSGAAPTTEEITVTPPQPSPRPQPNPNTPVPATIKEQSDNLTKALVSDPTKPQWVGISTGSLKDTSVIFAAGTLITGTDITLKQGTGMSSLTVKEKLGLEKSPKALGQSLSISLSQAVPAGSSLNITVPFHLEETAGLNLLEEEGRLVVVYRVVQSDTKIVLGVVEADNITKSGDNLIFDFAHDADLTEMIFQPAELEASEPTISEEKKEIATLSGEEVEETVVETPAPTPSAEDLVLDGDLGFGDKVIGTTNEVSVSLTNNFEDTLELTFGDLTVPFSLSGVDTCRALAEGESCTFKVTFTPSASEESTDTLSITFGDITVTEAISGTGLTEATLTISNEAIASTTLLAPSETTFTVTNTGEATATDIDFTFTAPFSRNGGTCSTSLEASATCTVIVSFTPTTVANHEQDLTIEYLPGKEGSKTTTRTLTASGTLISGLTVQNRYAGGGSNWLEWVLASNTDSPCDGSAACFHAGEAKKVALAGVNSCAGLTATDDLGAFTWTCKEINGVATFVTSRLKMEKGLKDLINWTNGIWAQNKVSVSYNGNVAGNTTLGTWWSNSLSSLTLSDSSTTTLNVSKMIYILESTQDTDGIILSSSSAIVIKDGAYVKGNLGGSNAVINFTSSATYLWIEGNVKAGNIKSYGMELNSNKYLVARHLFIADSGVHGALINGSMNRFENIEVSNSGIAGGGSDGIGFSITGTDSTYFNLKSNNNRKSGLHIANSSDDNIFVNILLNNNQDPDIRIDETTPGDNNTFLNFTLGNNNSVSAGAIKIQDGTTGNTFVQGLIVNANHDGIIFSTPLASGNTFSQMAIFDTNAGSGGGASVNQVDGNNSFKDNLLVTTDSCEVASGTIEFDSNCDESSNNLNLLEDTYAIGSTFLDYISSDEGTNPIDSMGVATYENIVASPMSWFQFDNFFRSWAKIGSSSFPNTNQTGPCTTASCQIFDWRLSSDDTNILNYSGDGENNNGFVNNDTCPVAVNGDRAITDTKTVVANKNTFLINATEIVDDAVGDEDGLCESNEACIYSPNFGVYQGEGDYKTMSCAFTDGTITGVTMYAYPTNGVSTE